MNDPLDAYHLWLGIPPSEQPPNAYRLLGLRPLESDPEVIQNAVDRQTLHLRTYQLGKHSEVSERLLNEVAAASLTLLNPAKKAEYDRRLAAELHLARPASAAPPPSSGQPAVLGVPRMAGPAPLVPLARRRKTALGLPQWLLTTVAVMILFGATIALLGYSIASLLTSGRPAFPSTDQTEPATVPPAEPAPQTTTPALPVGEPEPDDPKPTIVIDSSHHRPSPPPQGKPDPGRAPR